MCIISDDWLHVYLRLFLQWKYKIKYSGSAFISHCVDQIASNVWHNIVSINYNHCTVHIADMHFPHNFLNNNVWSTVSNTTLNLKLHQRQYSKSFDNIYSIGCVLIYLLSIYFTNHVSYNCSWISQINIVHFKLFMIIICLNFFTVYQTIFSPLFSEVDNHFSSLYNFILI